jgi:hypothetical protein
MKATVFYDFADWTLVACGSAIPSGILPGAYRSITSRAYYAAFNRTIELLNEMAVPIPASEKHQRIPLILIGSSNADLQQLGRWLDAFRLQRSMADYELSPKQSAIVENVGFATARTADARRIIARINSFMTGRGVQGSKFESAKASVIASAAFVTQGPSASGS